MIWLKTDLVPTSPIDSIVFDVDGVLIDDTVSYYAAIKAAVRHIVQQLYGRPAPAGEIGDAEIKAFKAAGGFNNDWVLTYAAAGLILAGAATDGSDLIRIAGESAGRGMPWMRQRYFPHLQLEFDLAERVGMEYYWGAKELRRRWGLPAMYHAGEGFVRLEAPLYPSDFFEQLRRAGVARFGVITGRNAIEMQSALETLGLVEHNPFMVILDADSLRKPDPAAMRAALDALGARSALYVGDTGDDLQLVLNYRAGANPIPCLAAIVAKAGQRDYFAAAGADLVLDAAGELPTALAILRRLAADAGPTGG
jgi:HAD superfamily phosphatase